MIFGFVTFMYGLGHLLSLFAINPVIFWLLIGVSIIELVIEMEGI